ncbi:MAG: 5-formyltetrahydrofolate cyclo-ligase [Bacteroidota bacterium]
MPKKELRLDYQKLRNKLSPEALDTFSLQIANKLLKLPIWSLDYYHLFLSIAEKKEIDTSFILSILQGKDKNIVLPKMTKDGALVNYLLTDATTIKKNKWNVPEPLDGLEVPIQKIDVVFIPLLAFDIHGNRVGYGKGFYDHFLAQCRLDVIKVGLSFFEAEKEKITDINEDDVPINYCITPLKIYEF